MANINLKDFPDDLHTALKIKAAVEKTTLREIIIRAMAAYVGQDAERPKKRERAKSR